MVVKQLIDNTGSLQVLGLKKDQEVYSDNEKAIKRLKNTDSLQVFGQTSKFPSTIDVDEKDKKCIVKDEGI